MNPADYNIPPDTDIPVVLAYNMSHYESMEPRSETDVRMTINLVKQYLEGRYRYRNHDLQYLISTQALRKEDALLNATEINNLTRIVTEEINNDQDKHRTIQGGKKRAKLESSNEENIGDQDDISCSSLHSKKNPDGSSRNKDQDMASSNNGGVMPNKEKNNQKTQKKKIPDKNSQTQTQYSGNDFDESSKQNDEGWAHSLMNMENLTYRLKNSENLNHIIEIEGKQECPFCRIKVKNVHLHFTRNIICGGKVDMEHFSKQFETYKKNKSKLDNQERQRKWAKKEKEANPQTFNKKQAARKENSRQRKKAIDLESFNKKNAEGVEKTRQKRKAADLESFNKKNAEGMEKSRKLQQFKIDDRQ